MNSTKNKLPVRLLHSVSLGRIQKLNLFFYCIVYRHKETGRHSSRVAKMAKMAKSLNTHRKLIPSQRLTTPCGLHEAPPTHFGRAKPSGKIQRLLTVCWKHNLAVLCTYFPPRQLDDVIDLGGRRKYLWCPVSV